MEVGGLSCTRGIVSITWGLEKHSFCILVKEQLVIQVREDLISTRRQVKVTRSSLCDSCSSSISMSGLRF
jgi:hypothetical protein